MWWLLLIFAGAQPEPAPTPQALWPCQAGLSLTYQVHRAGKDTGIRITETVRGLRPGQLCIVDRITKHPESEPVMDAFALEVLKDRIAYAGYADAPTAFRPPIVKAPIRAGATWTFNRVGYRIEEVGTTFDTPAGTFPNCTRISEADLKGKEHKGYAVYAPGVGPIIKVTNGTRLIVETVRKPPAKPRKSRGH
jgi:hypothetical protein